MSLGKICPSCGHDNELNARECANCNMPFQYDERTPGVSVEFRSDPSTQEVKRVPDRLPPNVIALQVVSDPAPILIPYQSQQRIILGRDLPEGDFYAVDLSSHRAQVLGVSRQHAVIHIADDDCMLEDLNSSNGTWLNEARLLPQQPVPLEKGDLIRLGHLMIFISF
jgi:hypothetical protein